jgi:hypothetical protein
MWELSLQKGDSFSVSSIINKVNSDRHHTPVTMKQVIHAVNDWKAKGVVVTSGAIGKFNWSE